MKLPDLMGAYQDSGIERIEQAFVSSTREQIAALMPYFTIGYPTLASSIEIICQMAPYSDLIELGIPFSDPIADGPSIQKSSQIALEKGMDVNKCLQAVAAIRARRVSTPILLMSYYNPILAYREDRFVEEVRKSGADGLIVPDLPPEESEVLREHALNHGLALIYFVAPSSSPARIEMIAAMARSFIYMVSVTGVTGAREGIDSSLGEFVKALKKQTSLPIAVGFGISSPEQVRTVGRFADGVIIGSKLIDTAENSSDKPKAVADFLWELKRALLRNESLQD